MRMGKQNARLRGTKTPRPIWAATALLLAGAALGSNAARSAELPLSIDLSHCPPEQSLRWRGGTLRLENDLFTGTDRNYTNGVALTTASAPVARVAPGAALPAWAQATNQKVPMDPYLMTHFESVSPDLSEVMPSLRMISFKSSE